MKVKYSVSFEFDTLPPVTYRSTVVGSSGAVCGSRAVKAAQKALRPVNWSSMVCCLLERVDTLDESAVALERVPSVA